MLANSFRIHGEFCAAHPWEIILGTITLLSSLLSFDNSDPINNLWLLKHRQNDIVYDSSSYNFLIRSVIRGLTLFHLYKQLGKLRRYGFRYVLGVVGFVTLFSAFLFSMTVSKILGAHLGGADEALPFFLLLLDLDVACELGKVTLQGRTQAEVISNLGRGMAFLGPSLTLDCLFQVLVIAVGLNSGFPALEYLCSFACLSVIANYLAFVTIFPTSLAIVAGILAGRFSLECDSLFDTNVVRLKKQQTELSADRDGILSSRLKLIMIVGLVLMHLYNGILAPRASRLASASVECHRLEKQTPYWHWDCAVMLSLACLYFFKFMKLETRESVLMGNADSESVHQAVCATKDTESECHLDCGCDVGNSLRKTSSNFRSASFLIGDLDQSDLRVRSVFTQTCGTDAVDDLDVNVTGAVRSPEECLRILRSEAGPLALSDAEIVLLAKRRDILPYALEKVLGDCTRAVRVRRKLLTGSTMRDALKAIPYLHFDYDAVLNACCENVIGFIPLPLGVVGPLLVDGVSYQIPLATTEGTLVASTNRGCRCITSSGGAWTVCVDKGMTRAPAVSFPSLTEACEARTWVEDTANFSFLSTTFNGSSRFARLQEILVFQVNRVLYLRFRALTGDAMGMNMLSKGAERTLISLQERFPNMSVLGLSGNLCTDKKPAAINWILGRGKEVVVETLIPRAIVEKILKTTAERITNLNIHKNLVGSAVAGAMGGFNAHAANILAALFIASGQDPAQVVESCNCLTFMEANSAGDLSASCTLRSLELGTVGGGSVLPPQAACLTMMGVQGSHAQSPGCNAQTLARITASVVLAGELSLMAALAEGHLVSSHMRHNRSSALISQPATKV